MGVRDERRYGLDTLALIKKIDECLSRVEQYAQWLREVTQERDALKMQVAELEQWCDTWRDRYLKGSP